MGHDVQPAIDLESEFDRFRRAGDVDALARVFDATAPGLLGVARHLGRGAAEAEDLVQATYVTAIERAATFDASRSLLGWLTGILALHAKKSLRQASRTVDPERLSPRDAEDPFRAARDAEVRAAVDRAVGGLDEGHSAVLRLHLEGDLPPREIARALSLDPGTARVRIHRALAKLRAALPAGLAGFGAAHVPLRGLESVRAAVLARGAEHAAAPAGASASTATVGAGAGISASLALAAALVLPLVAGGVGYVLLRGGAGSDANGALGAVAPPELATPGAPLADPGSPPSARAEPAPRADAPSVPADRADDGRARVAGRLLRLDGRPAVGAEVALHGWAANQERVIDFPPPADWKDPAPVRADADGRFAISVDPPRAFQFALDAKLAGHADLAWRWTEILPGAHEELRERSFERACTLHVRVVDAAGKPLGTGFSVSAQPARGDFGSGPREPEDTTGVSARYEEALGLHVLEGVPPGATEIRARSDLTGWLEPARVVADPDSPREVEIVYDGPDTSRRIVVRWSTRPFHTAGRELGAIRLRKDGAEPRTAAISKRSPGTANFDHVGPGTYVIEIEDPRFEPFVATGVEPGSVVRAKLSGNAGLKVVLRRNGEPLDARVEKLVLRYTDSDSRPNEFDLLQPELLPVVEGFITGIVPGRCELLVHAKGYAEAVVDLGELRPGERRVVTVEPGASRTLRGVALDGRHGPPASGVRVLLTRGERSGHGLGRGTTYSSGAGTVHAADSSVATDAEGRFAFEGTSPGPYVVRVAWSEWLFVDRAVAIGADAPEDLVIVRPPAGELEVVVRVPVGSVHDRLSVDCMPIVAPGTILRRAPLQHLGETFAPDVPRILGPYPPGRYRVTPSVGFGGFATGGASVEAEIVAGGRTAVVLDLTATMPGRIAAVVRRGSRLATEGHVQVMHEGGEPKWGIDGVSIEADGTVPLGGVAPGTLHLVVLGPKGSWAWTDPRPHVLEPGQALSVEIDVPWIERVLVARGPDGAPLARREIEVGMGDVRPGWGGRWATVRTDAEGRATVGLPVGAARLRLPGGEERPLEWSAALSEEVEVKFGN